MENRNALTIEALQSVLDEKQRLLDEALVDLAQCHDCNCCANLSKCSNHRVERNMAYGGCADWQWRGAKSLIWAS
jgi:hypothetical protein